MNPVLITKILLNATKDASPEKCTEVVARFITFLKQHKRMSLLPHIVKEAMAQQSRHEPRIEVASSTQQEKLSIALNKALSELLLPQNTPVHINPALLSGFIARNSTHCIDASGKTALIRLYQTLTI